MLLPGVYYQPFVNESELGYPQDKILIQIRIQKGLNQN